MDGKCSATNKDGTPCSGQHFRDGWCRWHHPEQADQMRAARVKGGLARSNKARARKALPDGLKTMTEIQALLCLTLSGVLTGRIEPGVGNAVANIARAIRDVGGAAEIEARLAALERVAGGRSA